MNITKLTPSGNLGKPKGYDLDRATFSSRMDLETGTKRMDISFDVTPRGGDRDDKGRLRLTLGRSEVEKLMEVLNKTT